MARDEGDQVMQIYIPSLGRASAAALRAGPLADLPERRVRSALLVVPSQEAEAYMGALREVYADENRPCVLGVEARGIAATRLVIGEHARDCGRDRFVMMDDDVRFLVRKSAENWQLHAPTTQEVEQMLSHVSLLLDTHAHVGVSAREGNNRAGVGGPEALVRENTRTLRVLAYRTADFLACEHGRVEVMEDFDVNLQLLERGLSNACTHYYAQGQKMTNAPGGCSTYRSHAVHEASARRLAELHPGLVRLRQKENKTDREGFGTRTEVTISWQKAHQQGLQTRARAAADASEARAEAAA